MTENDVRDPCRALRNAAPQQWEAFVAMFTTYTAEAVDAVSEADAAEIMTQKGRAQVCKALLKTFKRLDPPPSA
jgi:hypothetical protein